MKKKNRKDYKTSWTGYKIHLDVADGGIPISGLLTPASTHDSQVAIPVAQLSHERVVNLYDLMDSAYDVSQIHEVSRQLGHRSLIDVNPRHNQALKEKLTAEIRCCRFVGRKPAEAILYNARLKDEFGGRMVRVRGHAKVMSLFDVWYSRTDTESTDDFHNVKTLRRGIRWLSYTTNRRDAPRWLEKR